MNEVSMLQNEFYDLSRQNSNSKYTIVYIYDIKLSKTGKARDSLLKTSCSVRIDKPAQDNYTYSYDSLNREKQRFEVRNGNKILNAERLYNDKGKLSEWIWYNTDGKVHSKTFYEYDLNGNLILSNQYYGYWYLDKPKLERRIEYQYADSKLTEKKEYYDMQADSSWFQNWTTKFDTKGNVIFYRDEFDKFFWNVTSEYDNQNKLIKETIEGNERKKSVKEYLYSSDGLPLQIYWYHPTAKKKNIRLTRYYYQ
ncbi:hypothetical protein [Phnomibacter sp. MR]|uniref:hypothetical protein n=1 Tax=Phnomibacter sp. MR TaxID=3042318 RepID=UPI003A805D5D